MSGHLLKATGIRPEYRMYRLSAKGLLELYKSKVARLCRNRLSAKGPSERSAIVGVSGESQSPFG